MDSTSKTQLENTHHHHHKIVSVDKIKKNKNNKVVQCHGVFDLLHIGHIKHLYKAKTLGDILVVTITADQFVNKGPGRPYFSEHHRAEALAALACVDFVVINHHPTAVEAIQLIQPNFYVKGVEYAQQDITGKIIDEEEAVKSVGGELIFSEDIVFSSSTLLNRFFPTFPAEVTEYLNQLKTKYSVDDVIQYIEGAKNLNVLLIGEAIIDIYHYGEAIGKSGKEPVLVTKYNREETYIGGALAVANHLSTFCKKVTCITLIGEDKQYEALIRQNLKENVEVIFQYKRSSPTIVKRRYIEEYSLQKLFEIYEIEDCYLDEDQQKDLINDIDNTIENHDVVIVADYGHGLLNQESVERIQQKAKFLAVNTQANASNHGFNCISKYQKADFVCIATRELQLNYRQKHISVVDQLTQLQKEHDYKNVIITNGTKGSFSCRTGEDIHQIPAFTTTVRDRVGAGDAVLAITSLCVAQNAPAEVTGFIGNVVGSQAVNIMGNKSYIEKVPLMKHIVHIMK